MFCSNVPDEMLTCVSTTPCVNEYVQPPDPARHLSCAYVPAARDVAVT